jgi:DNA-directed RNA polymerase subunit RPC12/RpoP
MPVLLMRISNIDPTPNDRPRHCPYCGSQILQRWGRVSKSVRDPHHETTEVHRYRCTECGRTFRDYPDGVDRANQSQRIRHLAALSWALGLSCRDVVAVFQELGVRLSRMTVWRDGQELLDRLNADEEFHSLPNCNLDRSYPHFRKPGPGVTLAIDLGRGKRVILGTLDEHNPRVVQTWLQPLVQGMELEVTPMETETLSRLMLTGTGSLRLPN